MRLPRVQHAAPGDRGRGRPASFGSPVGPYSEGMTVVWTSSDDGQEIYYDVAGEGPALVFMGGFGGIADVWAAQVSDLSDEFRCVTYDLRGYGRSGKPVPDVSYGTARHVSDVLTVMDAADVDRAVVVGHSLGGNNALDLALDHPDRVSALVLVGTFAAGEQVVEAAGDLDVAAFIKDSIRQRSSRFDFFMSSGATEEISMESTKWPTYALMGNLETFLAFDARDRLGNISMGTLVIHGDADQVAPLEPCGRYLADQIPNAQLEVIPGGNHCTMIQKPDMFNDILRRFARSTLNG